LISLKNICKVYKIGYGFVPALKNINIELEDGGFLSIMGPSGSGKSTLLNIMGCLDTQSGGEYYLNGIHVAGLSDEKKAHLRNQTIGFIFQSFHLIPSLTAFENIMIPMEIRGARNARDRAELLLKSVDLTDRGHHYPSELSGGEQQRVAIARAFANSPKILLADEPTGNLDSKNGQHIFELMTNLHSQNDVTLVLVTHDAALAGAAQRQIILKDGRVVGDELERQKPDRERGLVGQHDTFPVTAAQIVGLNECD
jgi:putative ABC transport system ATP-binding protein